jgi:hypothetical protein
VDGLEKVKEKKRLEGGAPGVKTASDLRAFCRGKREKSLSPCYYGVTAGWVGDK